MILSLRQILEQHPEWADLPVAVYVSDGSLDYVGEAGMVYLSDEIEPVTVVFSAN